MKRNAVKKNATKALMLALAVATTGLMSIATPIRAASSAGSSTTPPPRPNPGQAVLDNIAAKLGRALTEAEVNEIKAALKAAKDEIEEANATAVEDIADTFGLTVDQVKAALQKRAPLVQTLSELVGHKLTQAEIQALRDIMKARRDALKKIHDELVESIASSTGLTPEETDEALRPPPPPKPPEGKPGDKPGCKPPGGPSAPPGA